MPPPIDFSEYLYVNLGGDNFGATFVPGATSTPLNSNFGVNAGSIENHIARLKVNFKL